MNNEFLIRRAKKDDKDAFCRLMDEHLQCMYKMASAYLKNDEDVADAIQDTILSCYENLRSLKQNRYFKTWMLRILINKCKDILKQKKQVTYTDQMPETPFYEEEYAAKEWHRCWNHWIQNIGWLFFCTIWKALISGKLVTFWI